MVSPADAERFRQAQAAIRPLVERDLARFWRTLNMDRPEMLRDALLEYMPVLVSEYGGSAAAVAADWYDEMRAAERVAGRFRAVMQESPYMDAVDGTVRRAAGDLFTGAPERTLASLTVVIPKYVLAAGRQTVVRSTDLDPQAVGWQRVTRAGACEFCRMLAGRGGVYKRETVHFASHVDCNCAAAPSWDRNAPEVDVSLYQASKRTTTMSSEQRERHNATIRNYLSGMDN